MNEQDIIEDIAIAYGYDKIKPLPIRGFSTGVPEEYQDYLTAYLGLWWGSASRRR